MKDTTRNDLLRLLQSRSTCRACRAGEVAAESQDYPGRYVHLGEFIPDRCADPEVAETYQYLLLGGQLPDLRGVHDYDDAKMCHDPRLCWRTGRCPRDPVCID